MFKLIAVTNRHLCRRPFLEQIERIAMAGVDALILREKDLEPQAYIDLARQVLTICRQNNTACILHTFTGAALELNAAHIHVSLPILTANPAITTKFAAVGVSVHSVTEAMQAAQLGATYLIAGHIFATDCKPGLEARGTSLLTEIMQTVTLPLYAIGGITPDNIAAIKQNGAAGACLMSSLMKTTNPKLYLTQLREAVAEGQFQCFN